MWQTIIFQNNRALNIRKDPVKPRYHTLLAAQVFLSIIAMHFAWPINLRDDRTHLFAALRIRRVR